MITKSIFLVLVFSLVVAASITTTQLSSAMETGPAASGYGEFQNPRFLRSTVRKSTDGRGGGVDLKCASHV